MENFNWSTEYCHHDNSFTMNDYLDNHLVEGAKIMFQEGSYAEVILDGQRYGLDAKGNGDSFNHIVEVVELD